MTIIEWVRTLTPLGGRVAPLWTTRPKLLYATVTEGTENSRGRFFSDKIVTVRLIDPDLTRYANSDLNTLTNLYNQVLVLRDIHEGGVIDEDPTPGRFISLSYVNGVPPRSDPDTKSFIAEVNFRVSLHRMT